MKKGKKDFSGLELKELIGAPLKSAADASRQLTNSTIEFINNVGFGTDEKRKKKPR